MDLAVNGTKNFAYTGTVQGATLKKAGYYKLEVWGASGGGAESGSGIVASIGTPPYVGMGGYSVGVINVSQNSLYYIYVGGEGQTKCNTYQTIAGGWNGGGMGHNHKTNTHCNGGGGGSTDIRTEYAAVTYQNYSYYTNSTSSLSSRLIVAGGGGGMGQRTNYESYGGSGGGYIGNYGLDAGKKGTGYKSAAGGTQTSAGDYYAGFGYGGATAWQNSESGEPDHYYDKSTNPGCGGGGGGGWYGGGASGQATCNNVGGAGGSGYIGGVVSAKNITKQMYGYSLYNTSTSASTKTTSTTSYSSTATANYAKAGNGYARITYLGT